MIEVDDIKWYNIAKNSQHDNLINSKINGKLKHLIQKFKRLIVIKTSNRLTTLHSL